MKSKTIVLWGREDILSSSVELFLTKQKGWKVVNISNEENLDVLIKTMDKLKPDVVIIPQRDHADNLKLPTVLFDNHPELRVITVSPNDNSMEVYSRQNIVAKAASDLIAAIENDLSNQTKSRAERKRSKLKGGGPN